MAVADLVNKINDDTRVECEAILSEAREEVAKIEKATESRIEALRQKNAQEIQALLDATRRKVESSAEREGKLKLEALKRQLLDEVFATAEKKILELNDSDYQAFLEKQLTDLPDGLKAVAVVPSERVNVTKKALKSAGVQVSEIEEADFKAGVLLRGSDFEFDLSVGRILSEVKAKREMEIANELLSE